LGCSTTARGGKGEGTGRHPGGGLWSEKKERLLLHTLVQGDM